MTIGSYGVNYPADVSATKGSNDMSAHVQHMAASCPNTKLVLGGYSLGAAAADVVVAMNQPGFGYTDVLPANMDQHVAAVALFGNGTQRVVGEIPGPRPAYAGKIVDLCAAGDPICTPRRTRSALVVAPAAVVHHFRVGRSGRRLRRRQAVAKAQSRVRNSRVMRFAPRVRSPAGSPRRPASTPAAARPRSRWTGRVEVSSSRHHVAVRRCSPTASSAPTSDRTIDQQNASAVTCAVIRSPSRVQSNRCRSRMVVAPRGDGRTRRSRAAPTDLATPPSSRPRRAAAARR